MLFVYALSVIGFSGMLHWLSNVEVGWRLGELSLVCLAMMIKGVGGQSLGLFCFHLVWVALINHSTGLFTLYFQLFVYHFPSQFECPDLDLLFFLFLDIYLYSKKCVYLPRHSVLLVC